MDSKHCLTEYDRIYMVITDRFFDGAMKQMVVSFLDQKDLTPEDLDELQSILDKKRQQ